MVRGLGAKVWAAMLAVYIIWGSTYLAIRYMIDSVPPFIGAGARWVVAGGSMLALGLRRSGARPTALQWRNAAVVGMGLCLGGNGLVSVAEHRISSGMAALLVATLPLFVAVFEFVRRRTRLPRVVVGGLILGFGGTAILVRPTHGAGAVDTIGALLVLGAAVSWAMGSLFSRNADLPAHPFVSTGMEMLCGGIALFVVGSIGGEFGRLHVERVTGASVAGLAYLIVFGSLVAFSSYVWLLRNVKLSVVTTYAYVNPLVAVILGALFRDEKITGTAIVGGAVILASVAIIVAASGDRPHPPGEVPPEQRADLATRETPG